jgi:putative hydrolase of the HAD superfamily
VPTPRYRCIAFDAVGTLIHPQPPAGEAYYAAARKFGSQLGLEEITRRFHQVFHEMESADWLADGGCTTDEVREEERWRGIVSRVIDDITDPAGCFAELFAHFSRSDNWRCFDDVPEGLERLHAAGYRLAIASNFDGRLHSVCDGLEGLRPIDFRIISAEVGCRKPAQGFFEALVRGACCEVGEVLMIGDDPANDVDGAREAGLAALLINRRGPRRPDEIGSLLELAERLAG